MIPVEGENIASSTEIKGYLFLNCFVSKTISVTPQSLAFSIIEFNLFVSELISPHCAWQLLGHENVSIPKWALFSSFCPKKNSLRFCEIKTIPVGWMILVKKSLLHPKSQCVYSFVVITIFLFHEIY